MLKILILLVLFIGSVSSCTGYRFQEKDNPFSQYGIRSLSIPMFYNQSNFSNLSGPFTKEIVNVLSEFKGLRLYTGKKKADAVLIGIIESNKKKRESKIVTSSKSVKNTYGEDSIGTARDDFNLPRANKLRVRLRIIVIKHPTEAELRFFQTDMSSAVLSSKVIFNEKIHLEEDFSLKELQGEGINVLGSQNDGVERQALGNLAKEGASSFKDIILYAF